MKNLDFYVSSSVFHQQELFLFGLLGFCKGFGPYSLPAISDLLAASLKLLIFRAEFGEILEKNHSCIAVQIAYGNNFVFCNL